VNAAIGHFQAFFETEGGRHFEIEERCLVPAWVRDGGRMSP
jgi:hypothetical protein